MAFKIKGLLYIVDVHIQYNAHIYVLFTLYGFQLTKQKGFTFNKGNTHNHMRKVNFPLTNDFYHMNHMDIFHCLLKIKILQAFFFFFDFNVKMSQQQTKSRTKKELILFY